MADLLHGLRERVFGCVQTLLDVFFAGDFDPHANALVVEDIVCLFDLLVGVVDYVCGTRHDELGATDFRSRQMEGNAIASADAAGDLTKAFDVE